MEAMPETLYPVDDYLDDNHAVLTPEQRETASACFSEWLWVCQIHTLGFNRVHRETIGVESTEGSSLSSLDCHAYLQIFESVGACR